MLASALLAGALGFGMLRSSSGAAVEEAQETDEAEELLGPRADLVDEAPPARPEPAPSFREPFFPFLDDEDTSASVSVGDTSHGWIVNAKQLVAWIMTLK